MKYYFELAKGKEGTLNDGRHFIIKSIPKVIACSDGTLKYGDVEVKINNKLYWLRIKDFVDGIASFGDLNISK